MQQTYFRTISHTTIAVILLSLWKTITCFPLPDAPQAIVKVTDSTNGEPVQPNGRFVVTCHSSHPTEWYFNGTMRNPKWRGMGLLVNEFPTDDPSQAILLEGGMLYGSAVTVRKALPSHQGKYECKAEDGDKSVADSSDIRLASISVAISGGSDAPISALTSSYNITCLIKSNVVETDKFWIFDGGYLMNSSKYTIFSEDYESRLILHYPNKTDTGSYSCGARRVFRNVQQHVQPNYEVIARTRIVFHDFADGNSTTVEPVIEPQVLKVKAALVHKLVPESNLPGVESRQYTSNALHCPMELTFRIKNKPFDISCQLIDPRPASKVIWRFAPFSNETQKTVITSGEVFSQLESGFNLNLTIKSPAPVHAGFYECSVQFPEGEISKTVALNLLPFIKPLEKNTRIVQGNTLEVQCIENDTPNILLTWKRDGEPFLPNDTRISLLPNSKNQANGLLVFNPAEYEDIGNYTCVAMGETANDTSSTFIKVKDPLAWLYPMIGTFVCILVLVAILGTDHWLARKNPDRVSADPSDTSIVMKVDVVTEANLRLNKMLKQAEAFGYPPSVVYAAVKWRAKVEQRNRSIASAAEAADVPPAQILPQDRNGIPHDQS